MPIIPENDPRRTAAREAVRRLFVPSSDAPPQDEPKTYDATPAPDATDRFLNPDAAASDFSSADTAPASPPSPPVDYAAIAEVARQTRQQQDHAFLAEAMRKSFQSDLDHAAAVKRVATTIGLPEEYVVQNFDRLSRTVEAAGFDLEAWKTKNPEIIAAAKANPGHAEIIVRDESLSALSKAARAIGAVGDAWDKNGGDAINRFARSAFFPYAIYSGIEATQEAVSSGAVSDAMQPKQISYVNDARAQEGQSASSPKRIWMAIQDSEVRQDISKLGFSIAVGRMRGADVRADEEKLAQLQLDARNRYYGTSGGEQFLVDAYEGISSSIEGLKGGLAGAATGAAAAASLGAVLGPADAVPATVGANVGWKAGAALSTFRLETGSAYLQFRDLTTDDGTPIDDRIALGAAVIYGVAAAGIETYSFGATGEALGPIGKAMQSGKGVAFVRDAVKNVGFRRLAIDAAKSFAESGMDEGVEEFVQSYAQSLAGYGAKTYQANPSASSFRLASEALTPVVPEPFVQAFPRVESPQAFDSSAARIDAWDSMAKSWASAPFLAIGGGMASATLNYTVGQMKYGEAQRSVRTVEQIHEVAAGPTNKSSPEVAAKAVAEITSKNGDPVDDVYVDVDRTIAAIVEQGVDPTEVFARETMEEMASASATGALAQIPLADYLTALRKIPEPDLLKPHTTTKPHLLTGFQLNQEDGHAEQTAEQLTDEFMQQAGLDEQAANQGEAQKQTSKTLRTLRSEMTKRVKQQLISAGMNNADASAGAKIIAARLKVVAEAFKASSKNPLAEFNLNFTSDGAIEFRQKPPAPAAAQTEMPQAPAAPAPGVSPTPSAAPEAPPAAPVADAPAPSPVPEAALASPAAHPEVAPAELASSSDSTLVDHGSLKTPKGVEIGKDTSVLTPQKKEYRAVYALAELGDLVASHNEYSFAKNPVFVEKTGDAQQRLYHQNKSEQFKVEEGASQTRVEYLLTDNPSGENGPPIATSGSTLLTMGGNGRTMMLKRIYREGKAEAYRAALREKVTQFGLKPESVDAMSNPVLVRVMVDITADSSHADMRAAVAEFNDPSGNATGPVANAISDAGRVQLAGFERLGSLLNESEDMTLRKAMAEKPSVFVEVLREYGVITDRNVDKWITKGSLTDDAKNRIEAMFVGRVLGTAERYNATPPSIRNKLERIVPHLLRVEAAANGRSEIETVRMAVDLIIDANARGMKAAQTANQFDIFSGVAGGIESQMAAAIEGKGQLALSAAFRDWANQSAFDPKQIVMFGLPTREQALSSIFTPLSVEKNPDGAVSIAAEVPPPVDPSAAPETAATPKKRRTKKPKLESNQGGVVRGYTKVESRNVYRVHFTKDGNLSTFLHETGHLFFLWTADLVERGDAPQSFKDDFQKSLAFAGFSDLEDMKRRSNEAAEIQKASEGRERTKEEAKRLKELVAPHEKFADAFMVYVSEGKAPSPGLVSVFARFRSFLLGLWRWMKGTDVELNDEIRGVFDRMLAVDEESYRTMRGLVDFPPFPMPVKGQNPAEFVRQLNLQERATSVAMQAAERFVLQREKLRPLNRKWKEITGDLLPVAQAQYEELPAVRAKKMIFGDGTLENQKPTMLRRDKVVEAVGVSAANSFPTIKDGGALIDVLAEPLGFPTGKQMLEAVLGVPDREKWVKRRMQELAEERHPELAIKREEIRKKIAGELHNDYYKMWLRNQWKALRKQAGLPEIPPKAIQRAAEMLAERMQINKLRPKQVLQQERAAANRSIRMATSGNFAGAAVAKQQQLLNAYLYSEVDAAFDQVEEFGRVAKRLNKIEARRRAGKVSPILLDGIDVMLEALGIRQPEPREKTPYNVREVIKFLTDFDLRDDVGDIAVSACLDTDVLESIVAGGPERAQRLGVEQTDRAQKIGKAPAARRSTVNVRYLTVKQMRAVLDYLTVLEHVSSGLSQLATAAGKIEFEAGIQQIIDEAQIAEPREISRSRSGEGRLERLKSIVRQYDAWAGEPERFLESLGLGKGIDSAIHRLVIQPLQEAKHNKSRMEREHVPRILEAFKRVPQSIRESWADSVDGNAYFPDHGVGKSDRGAVRLLPPMRKFELLMALANAGNESNLFRLLAGTKTTIEQFQLAWADHLTREDVEWVQSVIDACESLWPMARDLEREDTGIAPPKIEARSMVLTVKGGEKVLFRGGYFPVRYDRRVAEVGQRDDTSLVTPEVERIGTTRGFLQRRAKGYFDVISLEPGTFPEHIDAVLHDLAYRKAIRQAARILRHPRVENVITARLGGEYNTQILAWLRDVSRLTTSQRIAENNAAYKAHRYFRTVFIVRTLGYSFTVAAGDLPGISRAVVTGKLQPKYLFKGVFPALNPLRTLEVSRQSEEMFAEIQTRHEDLRREFGTNVRLIPKGKIPGASLLMRWNDFAFHLVANLDRVMTGVVARGAYLQAIDEGRTDSEAHDYANKVIRDHFTGHNVLDKSSALRDRGFFSAMNLFYGVFNKSYNMQRSLFDRMLASDGVKDPVVLAARMAALLFVEGPLSELFAGRGPEEDEEWMAWARRKMASFALSMIHAELAYSVEVAMQSLPGGELTVPRSSRNVGVASTIFEAYSGIKSALDDGADTYDRIEGAARAASVLVPIGGYTQLGTRTGRYLNSATSGLESSDSALQAVSGVLYGERDAGQGDNPLLMLDRILNEKD